jgi:hypothetical protein
MKARPAAGLFVVQAVLPFGQCSAVRMSRPAMAASRLVNRQIVRSQN